MRQKRLPIIVLSHWNSPLPSRRHQNSSDFFYDYTRGDFDGLRSSLQAANLSNAIFTLDLEMDGA